MRRRQTNRLSQTNRSNHSNHSSRPSHSSRSNRPNHSNRNHRQRHLHPRRRPNQRSHPRCRPSQRSRQQSHPNQGSCPQCRPNRHARHQSRPNQHSRRPRCSRNRLRQRGRSSRRCRSQRLCPLQQCQCSDDRQLRRRCHQCRLPHSPRRHSSRPRFALHSRFRFQQRPDLVRHRARRRSRNFQPTHKRWPTARQTEIEDRKSTREFHMCSDELHSRQRGNSIHCNRLASIRCNRVALRSGKRSRKRRQRHSHVEFLDVDVATTFRADVVTAHAAAVQVSERRSHASSPSRAARPAPGNFPQMLTS